MSSYDSEMDGSPVPGASAREGCRVAQKRARQNWAEHRRESARLSHPATIGPRCYRASLGVTQGSSLGRRVGSEKSVILTSVVGEKASVPYDGVDVCDGCLIQVVPEFGVTQRFT